MNDPRLDVLVCGYADAAYPRETTLVSALKGLDRVRVHDWRVVHDRWIRRHARGAARIPWRRLLPRLRRPARRVGRLSPGRLMPRVLVGLRRVDLVVVMKWNDEFVLEVCDWAARAGVPVAYDLWVSRLLFGQRSGEDAGRWYETERRITAACDLLMTLTRPYERFFTDTYPPAAGKTLVVPLGVPFGWLEQARREREPGARFVVGYWGNAHAHHGLGVALEAARLLRDRHDIEFRFMGSTRIERVIREAGPLENVRYLGWMETEEELIRQVDELDVAFGHLEPLHDAHLVLPNKALQGLARGVPVIHIRSDTMAPLDAGASGPLILFEGGAAGLARTISELACGQERLGAIGARGRAYIQAEHSIDRVAAALDSMLERL